MSPLNQALPSDGTVLITVSNRDKDSSLEVAKKFNDLGFTIKATNGTFKFFESHGMGQIAVRGREDANIGDLTALRTHRTKLPKLNGSEQGGLESHRQFTDLIQEESAALRELDEPEAFAGGARERATTVPGAPSRSSCNGPPLSSRVAPPSPDAPFDPRDRQTHELTPRPDSVGLDRSSSGVPPETAERAPSRSTSTKLARRALSRECAKFDADTAPPSNGHARDCVQAARKYR